MQKVRWAGGEQQPGQPCLRQGETEADPERGLVGAKERWDETWSLQTPSHRPHWQGAKRSKAREPKWRQLISSASSWLKITSLISLSEITTGLEIHCQWNKNTRRKWRKVYSHDELYFKKETQEEAAWTFHRLYFPSVLIMRTCPPFWELALFILPFLPKRSSSTELSAMKHHRKKGNLWKWYCTGAYAEPDLSYTLQEPKELLALLGFAKSLHLPSAHRFPLLTALSTKAPLSRAEGPVGAVYMLFLKDERQKNRDRALSELRNLSCFSRKPKREEPSACIPESPSCPPEASSQIRLGGPRLQSSPHKPLPVDLEARGGQARLRQAALGCRALEHFDSEKPHTVPAR